MVQTAVKGLEAAAVLAGTVGGPLIETAEKVLEWFAEFRDIGLD